MRCEHCPARDGIRCKAESPGWSFMCGMASNGNPIELAHIAAKSEILNAAPVDYPPIHVQAGNLVRAAGRFVRSGFATVDRTEYQRRRAICKGCEFFDAASKRCRQCGCSISAKPWSRSESCPVGKWG